MKSKYDIAIAGGGIVGLISAILLRKSRAFSESDIYIVEKNEKKRFIARKDIDIRVSAISAGSIQILKKINVWDKLIQERIFRYSNMCVWDGGDSIEGDSRIDFSSDQYGYRELGYIIENFQLQTRLIELAESLDVKILFDSEIESISQLDSSDKISIGIINSGSLEVDLLIGADGSESKTRQLMNLNVRKHNYSQSALITNVECEKHHCNTAFQRFLKHGPIALLPLGEKRSSIVWSTSPEEATFASKLSNEKLSSLLSEKSDHVLGELKVISEKAIYPLIYQHSKKYIEKNFVVVGDAAHTIHPLAGQGINLGIADAIELTGVLEDSILKGGYIGDISTLRTYERSRKSSNSLMLNFVHILNKLFSSRYITIINMRKIGMKIFNKTKLIKHQAIKTALGV